MNGSVTKFNKIFTPAVEYLLPYYQRCAVWNPEKGSQLQTLVNDILSLPKLPHIYYLGNILMHDLESENDTNGAAQYYLLDGQQRLTNILMIMLALYIKLDKKLAANTRLTHSDGTPIITLQREDRPDFERIMSQTTLDGVEGTSSLVKCFNYICERVKAFDGDTMAVINAINKMDVAQLIITRDDNPQLIFDRENGGGVRLTTGELVKNYLFYNSESEYYDLWHPLFCASDVRGFWEYDTAKEGMKKSEHNVMLDKFLHIVVRILCWQFRDHEAWTSDDRVEFVKENNIYWSLKEMVTRFGMSKLELAKEICEYGKLYLKYFNIVILNHIIPSTPCIDRIACLVLSKGCYVMVPYVLYVLRHVESKAERNRIFGVLENYMMRLIISKNENAGKRLSEFFSERLICSQVLTADDLQATIDDVEGQHRMPTDAEVAESLEVNKYKPQEMRVILYMHETRTGKCSFSFNAFSVCQLIPTIKFDRQHHLMTDAEIKAEKMSTGLANFILIKEDWTSELKKLKDASWQDKHHKLQLATVGISTSTNLLKSTLPMNLTRIETRAAALADCFNTVLWPAA